MSYDPSNPDMKRCTFCGGEGYEIGGGSPCPVCYGEGQVPRAKRKPKKAVKREGR